MSGSRPNLSLHDRGLLSQPQGQTRIDFHSDLKSFTLHIFSSVFQQLTICFRSPSWNIHFVPWHLAFFERRWILLLEIWHWFAKTWKCPFSFVLFYNFSLSFSKALMKHSCCWEEKKHFKTFRVALHAANNVLSLCAEYFQTFDKMQNVIFVQQPIKKLHFFLSSIILSTFFKQTFFPAVLAWTYWSKNVFF